MSQLNQNLSNFIDRLFLFINKASSVDINIYIIIIATILFILSYLSQHKMIQRLNLLLSFIPTLTHEMGHAIIAQLTGSKLVNVKMILTLHERDKTGALGFAQIEFKNWLSKVLSAFCGYIAPPLMFLTGIYLLSHQYSIVFVLLFIIMIINWFIHSSQKWVTLLIIIGMIALNIYPDLTQMPLEIILNIILGLLLGESIRSIFTTMQVNFKDKTGWDGSALKSSTLIPSTIWFFIWSVFSLSCIYVSFLIVFKSYH